jgi:tRNA A37 threonylcarbamoyladenosine modification protein TsaB
VALDARGGRFYHARYRRSELDVEVCEAPEALTALELAERCVRGGELLLAEPGLPAAAGLPDDVRVRPGARPTASALLALGRARVAAGQLAPAQALEPLYLARFGAR